MPQTSVLDAPQRALAGQIADAAPKYAVTALAEDVATTAINAGQFVLRGTDPDTQALAITDGATVDETTVLGLVLLETARAFEDAPPEEGSPLAVLRFGTAYVQVTAAVVAGNPVFVGNATAQLGAIDDAPGTGLVQVPGCRFLESAGAGEFAKIFVNLS